MSVVCGRFFGKKKKRGPFAKAVQAISEPGVWLALHVTTDVHIKASPAMSGGVVQRHSDSIHVA
eukprot:5642517-Prorocentrum_lima.AAC.1